MLCVIMHVVVSVCTFAGVIRFVAREREEGLKTGEGGREEGNYL